MNYFCEEYIDCPEMNKIVEFNIFCPECPHFKGLEKINSEGRKNTKAVDCDLSGQLLHFK